MKKKHVFPDTIFGGRRYVFVEYNIQLVLTLLAIEATDCASDISFIF